MTNVIANDTLEGMPNMGSDLGDFLGNLAPGLGKFMLIMAIFVGIAGIIASIAFVIVVMVRKGKKKV